MKSKIELQTIANIMEDLDYYQILKINKIASIEEVREAFHREALEFHPDQYAGTSNQETIELARKIYSKVVRAYQTLSQSSGRAQYDRKSSPSEEDNSVTGIQSKADQQKAYPGKKFFDLAQKALLTKNINAAKMNIQIAIGAEPDNPKYKELQRRIDQLK